MASKNLTAVGLIACLLFNSLPSAASANAKMCAHILLGQGGPLSQHDERVNKFLDVALNRNTNLTYSFNSSVQVRGTLSGIRKDDAGSPYYLNWKGATELRDSTGMVISGQGAQRHPEGFSSPIGLVKTKFGEKSLSSMKSKEELAAIGLIPGETSQLVYASGVKIVGIYEGATFSADGQLQILTFKVAKATLGTDVLYDPSWGVFDIIVGEKVSGVEQ